MIDINEHNYERTDDEAEIAQTHSIYLQMNAIAEHQRKMDAAGPSLSHCEECGEEIPVERQLAVRGCKTCIHCQSKFEKYKRLNG